MSNNSNSMSVTNMTGIKKIKKTRFPNVFICYLTQILFEDIGPEAILLTLIVVLFCVF